MKFCLFVCFVCVCVCVSLAYMYYTYLPVTNLYILTLQASTTSSTMKSLAAMVAGVEEEVWLHLMWQPQRQPSTPPFCSPWGRHHPVHSHIVVPLYTVCIGHFAERHFAAHTFEPCVLPFATYMANTASFLLATFNSLQGVVTR